MRTFRTTVLALALAIPTSSAVAAPPSMQPADAQKSIDVDGVARQYVLHVPPGHDAGKPMPLVVVLHGHGGNAKSMVKLTGFDAIADREGFIVAYVQGTIGSDGKAAWNTSITPDLGITAHDLKFMRALTAELEKTLGVDPRRVYAAGFSNGGFMSHRLAAEMSDVFAAVGVVEGTMGTKQDDGWVDIAAAKGPIPIAIMHGKKDARVRYDGGTSPSGHTARSVAFAIARWTKTDGCSGKPVKQTLVPKKVVTTDFTHCIGDNEVLLYTFLQGAHEWPTVGNAAGISGSEELWKFFARHPKPNKLAKQH